MPIKLTSTYFKIKLLTKKYKIVKGGQGAGKTRGLAILMTETALQTPKERDIILTDTYPRLRDGVIYDFEQVLTEMGLNWSAMYNKSTHNIRFPNGHEIHFRNVAEKNYDAGKGPRYHRLFINEGTRVKWPDIEQLWNRTLKDVYVDFNPDREFWAFDKDVMHDYLDDTQYLTVTYLDNEQLPTGEKKTILAKRKTAMEIRERQARGEKLTQADNAKLLWWRVYGEGELGTYTDRQIYTYEFCDEIPADAKRINSAIDFGMSPDPTILVDMWVKGSDLYCDEVFCENNLRSEQIPGDERMSLVDKMIEVGHNKNWRTICDTNDMTARMDLHKHKFNVIAVKKTKGSIKDGIIKVKSFNIFLTRRSINIKKGIENWFFKTDHNNKIIPEPDGHEPDGLAAIRYGIMTYRQ